jgi:hypothetical protein
MNQPNRSWFDILRPCWAWLLFVVAFGYRLLGIGWGLPDDLHNQSYHPDEQVIWTFSRGVEPSHLRFTPGAYNYGTLYLTLLRVGSDAIATYGGAPRQGDPVSLWSYIKACHLFGRVLSALSGAGTAVLVFLMLRRFTRIFGALAGGSLIALAPAFVVHSRFQTVDALATFLLAASLYCATWLLPGRNVGEESEDWRQQGLKFALLAGLFAGLSAGTKYTGILAVLALIVAVLTSGRQKKGTLIGVGVLAALLAFIVSTPGVLLDRASFIRDFKFEMLHTSTGHGLVFTDAGSGFWVHFRNLMEGMSPLICLLAIVGVAFAAFRRQKWMWVLLAFCIPYYILIGRAEVLFLRYTFPLYVVLAAGFGWWMGFAHEKKGAHRIVAAGGLLTLGMCARAGMLLTLMMSSPDPRNVAALTLRAAALQQPKARVGIVSDPWYYSPPLIPESAMMRGPSTELLQLREMSASQRPKLVQYVPPQVDQRFDWDVRLIHDLKPEYITFSSFEVGDVWRLRNSTDLSPQDALIVGRFRAFNTLLEQQYVRQQPNLGNEVGYDAANLLPQDLEYIRPLIWIWKRKDLP